MVVDEGPNIFHVQCICGRIRVSLEKNFVFIDYISLSLYVKYIWKK